MLGVMQRCGASTHGEPSSVNSERSAGNRLLVTQLLDKYGTVDNKSKKNAVALESITRDAAIKAIGSFQNGNLEFFDANAGDTACQIRAHKVTQLCNDSHRVQLDSELKTLLESLHAYSPAKAIGEQCVITGFPHVVSEDVQFLILSGLISEYKARVASDKQEVEAKEQRLNAQLVHCKIANKTLQDFLATARAKLNMVSNNHIRTLADQTGDLSLIAAIGQKATKGGITTHPCLFGFMAIMHNGQREGLPIVVKSRVVGDRSSAEVRPLQKLNLLFLSNGSRYEPIPLESPAVQAIKKSAALIVEGLTHLGSDDIESEINELMLSGS